MDKGNYILLFIDCLGAGGAQRQLVGLARMLKDHGYRVKVAVYYDIDFYQNQLEESSIKTDIIIGAADAKKRILAVRSYFLKEKPDWVIAYLDTPCLVACAAKVLGCRFKLIVSERNTTQRMGLNEYVRFNLFRFADYIVPNAYSQEKFLVNRYSWMKRKTTLITNFVDLDRFSCTVKERRSVPLIVVVSSIWWPKNTLQFLSALSIIKKNKVDFNVEWYGLDVNDVPVNVEYQERCFKEIDRLGLGDMIKLLPKSRSIVEKYQNADFFCLPSFYEGTPNVICEAMSCGLPIMCSDVCDNGQYVKEGVNGILFDPHSPQDMAEKIMKLLLISNECYTRLSQDSRKLAEEKLSKKLFLEKYLSLIESKL